MSKKRAKETQIFIGIYPIGHENVELYGLTNDNGGSFFLCPDDKSLPRIKIGLKGRHWIDCVQVVLHESLEFLMARLQYRWEQSGVYGDNSTYCFHFDHSQFTDLCQKQAFFVAKALPDLSTAWKKNQKGKK